RAEAIVMKPKAFTAWAKAQQQAAAKATQGVTGGGPGLAAFNTNGCSGCHTFKPAGSKATTGPDLDNLPADAHRAGKPLAAFVRESIVDPNAYIEKGYQPNIMPSTFKSLPKQQLDALVQFLTGGKKRPRWSSHTRCTLVPRPRLAGRAALWLPDGCVSPAGAL